MNWEGNKGYVFKKWTETNSSNINIGLETMDTKGNFVMEFPEKNTRRDPWKEMIEPKEEEIILFDNSDFMIDLSMPESTVLSIQGNVEIIGIGGTNNIEVQFGAKDILRHQQWDYAQTFILLAIVLVWIFKKIRT